MTLWSRIKCALGLHRWQHGAVAYHLTCARCGKDESFCP